MAWFLARGQQGQPVASVDTGFTTLGAELRVYSSCGLRKQRRDAREPPLIRQTALPLDATRCAPRTRWCLLGVNLCSRSFLQMAA
jgi:hypothetical protein